MNEHPTGPADLDTSERLSTIGGASLNAMTHKAHGQRETQMGADSSLSLAQAEVIVEAWPEAPQRVARQMMTQYGPSNEATRTKLFWYQAGP